MVYYSIIGAIFFCLYIVPLLQFRIIYIEHRPIMFSALGIGWLFVWPGMLVWTFYIIITEMKRSDRIYQDNLIYAETFIKKRKA